MARPLRIEFTGAFYHVTARGDRREDIYEDDEDWASFLQLLADVVKQFNWVCHAYCLMTNHYHLLIETPDGNLGRGMRQLNGVFTQTSNRRHLRTGHLFEGRYKAILVDKDAYLLELARYLVLNPVRAGLVEMPEQWPWSSYRSTVGLDAPIAALQTDAVLAHFGKRRANARKRYAKFVAEGVGRASVWENLRQQIYLGDEAFVARTQAQTEIATQAISIPIAQRRPPAPSLNIICSENPDRNRAIRAAYATGGYSYQQLADHFGIHPATVGRVVRKT